MASATSITADVTPIAPLYFPEKPRQIGREDASPHHRGLADIR